MTLIFQFSKQDTPVCLTHFSLLLSAIQSVNNNLCNNQKEDFALSALKFTASFDIDLVIFCFIDIRSVKLYRLHIDLLELLYFYIFVIGRGMKDFGEN